MTAVRRNALFALLLGSSAFVAVSAGAEELTVVDYGGQSHEAYHNAIFGPFAEANGVALTEDSYNGEVGPVKAQVDSGNVTWDVVATDSGEATTLCDDGTIMALDYSKIADKSTFTGNGAHKCGVASMVYSTLFAYDGSKVSKAPSTWAEFWDTKNFPGPRAMRKYVVGNLEFALMADGVPAAEVYNVLRTPEGVDRAFAKLDEIKPSVKVWWSAGAQSPQLLADGEVTYATGYSNRFVAANRNNGQDFKLSWDGNLADYEYLVIVSGSKHVETAEKLLAFASTAKAQAAMANGGNVGPAVKEAVALVDPNLAKDIPTSNLDKSLVLDTDFWADNLEDLNARFVTWLSQ